VRPSAPGTLVERRISGDGSPTPTSSSPSTDGGRSPAAQDEPPLPDRPSGIGRRRARRERLVRIAGVAAVVAWWQRSDRRRR
jgi:hypothetical protein